MDYPDRGFLASMLQDAGEVANVFLIGRETGLGRCEVQAVGDDAVVLRLPVGTVLVPFAAISYVQLDRSESYLPVPRPPAPPSRPRF